MKAQTGKDIDVEALKVEAKTTNKDKDAGFATIDK